MICTPWDFYPRSPCGERPEYLQYLSVSAGISIHALLAESDKAIHTIWACTNKFLSTLSLRRATCPNNPVKIEVIFLSTLSLRRATSALIIQSRLRSYFYPRSPCGERRHAAGGGKDDGTISIHALLAESDTIDTASKNRYLRFLSTLSLRRATCTPRSAAPLPVISIHALLAESDGGHQKQDGIFGISIHALLAESDVYSIADKCELNIFLSTLSLRRATPHCSAIASAMPDFYPRSPCGERPPPAAACDANTNFYPRSPCGERPPRCRQHLRVRRFLSTLSLRRATIARV